MNLLVNAVEALERHAPSNPTIEFRASSDHADGSLSLVFRDNGPGISEEVIRKAAEPFYTTKKRGLSTGLGLSVVDSFARMIGGEFRLESPESGGAVAALHLPAPASTPPPADSAQVGVDIEDPRISALCVELLRGMGCMMDDGKEQDHADFIVISREESERKGRRSSDDAAHTGPREIAVEPSRGMAGMRKTLFDALFPRNTT
jgi:hypothetical protein